MLNNKCSFVALPMGSSVDLLATTDPEKGKDDKETPIYEKFDATLHGKRTKK